MKRTYVVIGSASGIGLATKKKLEALGHKVIGIDIHEADIVADLSSHEGRKSADIPNPHLFTLTRTIYFKFSSAQIQIAS